MTDDILKALKAPFDPKRVSWRVGSTNADKTKGMALAYIDARDVQDRLDEVCGLNWACRYSLLDKTTICEIGVKVGEEWIWRADGSGDTDFEAEKGALSSAFKRAAVKFGIGRYLYDVSAPWVAITARGKSYSIDDGEKAKLERLLGRSGEPATPAPPSPAPAVPEKKAPASEASSAPDKNAEAKKWAREAIAKVKAMKTGAEYDAWRTVAVSGAIKRLADLDPVLFKELDEAVSAFLDRINPIGGG